MFLPISRVVCAAFASMVALAVFSFSASAQPAAPAPAAEQSATPSHTFQAVGTANAILQSLLAADLAAVPPAPDMQVASRLPRHVYIKALEVGAKIQVLRRLHGLPEQAAVPFPSHEIGPGDVVVLVQGAVAAVKELRPVFGNPPEPPQAAFVAGKTPTDVYLALMETTRLLHALGVPASMPNEVSQVALTIESEARALRAARNLPPAPPAPNRVPGHTPKHVFEAGLAVLAAVQDVSSQSPDLAIPGGVVVPYTLQSIKALTPGIVLDLMNNALAEVISLRMRADASRTVAFAEPQSGKSPADSEATLFGARTALLDIR